MSTAFIQIQASAIYSIYTPTLELLVNGVVYSSQEITSGSNSYYYSFNFTGNYPTTLSFRFLDGDAEGGRSVTISAAYINGQPLNIPGDLSSAMLMLNNTASVTIANVTHYFGREDPDVAEFTPDIVGTGGNDNLRGSDGRDIIDAGAGNDVVHAGSGGSVVFGGAGGDLLLGGAGADLISGDGDADTIIGNNGDDLLYGGAGNDLLLGGGGNDGLNGGADDDALVGGAGNDILYGEDGSDILVGDAGDDILYGDAGIDYIVGGAGSDTIYGGTEGDYIDGGADNDFLYGEDGDDSIIGGTGNDTIDGGSGIDRIAGGAGTDTLSGGANNDYILGEADNDTLNGDAGDDSLLGGSGADTLNGGADADMLYGHSLDIAAASSIVLGNAGVEFNLSTNSFYRLVAANADYATAAAAAAATTLNGVAGHLVTITSAVENTYIQTLAAGNAVWLGASDAESNGAWHWTGGGFESGLQFSNGAAAVNNFFENWDAAEPNGSGDYAVFETNGSWYDRAGTETHYYIIEWDGISFSDDNAADILNGDGGADILLGAGGNDTLSGGAGNDQLFGGAGDDTLNGDANDDYLADFEGTNAFNGGAGNDILDSRYHGTGTPPAIGVQTMNGGAGNDYLYGNTGADILNGDADDDFINGYEGADTIDGGTGNDTIYGGAGGDNIDGGENDDTIYAVMPSVTLLSTNFNGGTESFSYTDNNFGGSDTNNYVTGTRNTGDGVNGNGSLEVFFNGTNGTAWGNMSGAHSRTFTVSAETEDVVLEFDYKVIRSNTYESNEDSYVYVTIDGTYYGLNSNSHIVRYESNSGSGSYDSGWTHVTIDLGTLGAGNHTISVGGLVEGKDNANEDTTIRFDNIIIAADIESDDGVSNIINGGNGNDIIYGSAGTDTLSGGAGSDTIYSGSTANINVANVLANYAGVVHNATTGSFYRYVTTTLTWDAANSAAAANQIYGVAGHLVHVNSATENTYIDGITGGDNFWLGGSDGAVNGEWRWIGGQDDGLQFWQGLADGSAVGGAYTSWNPGEPNDWNGYEARLEFYNGGVWNDQLEGTTRRYLIEWEEDQILVSGNPTMLNGGAGVDNLYGGGGTDVFVFDNTANIDDVHDFDRTQGDALDISDILTGYDASDNIGDFVLISDGTGHTDLYEGFVENYAPLLYYRMNDGNSTAVDATGTLNGSYQNGPGYGSAGFNASLSNDSVNFNGSNEYLRVNDNAIFDLNAGTFMAWFRSDTTSATDQMIFSKFGTGGGRFYIGVDTQSGNVVGELEQGGNTYTINVDPAGVLGDDININTWYHLAFTFGTGGAQIFINGQSVYSNANFTSISGDNDFLAIGAENDGGTGGYFNGRIDEVTVFDTKMTAQTIGNIYTVGLAATDGAIPDGVYVSPDGNIASITQIVDFNGTLDVTNAVDMLANGNIIA